MSIEFIEAAQTIDLRHRVLRAHQPKTECHYPGDNDPDSFHLGAIVDGQIQCVASFYAQDTPYCSDAKMFRLRGMATDPEYRGQGLGRMVLDRGCEHALAQGATRVWCNARVSAMGFYTGRGFDKVSDLFEIEGIGDHYVLAKVL